MFLSNVANTVQALDARTGELLWENRLGPLATRAYSALRSLAVYEDKVYINATDARLYALDAKTGKVVWRTDIAEQGKGFNETGGLIVAHGRTAGRAVRGRLQQPQLGTVRHRFCRLPE